MNQVYLSVEIDPHYNRAKAKDVNKPYPVYIIVRQVIKKAYIRLRIPNILLHDFQSKNGNWIKSSHPDHKKINLKINKVLSIINQFIYYEDHDYKLTPEKVKEWYLSKYEGGDSKNQKEETFTEYFQRLILKERKGDKQFQTVLSKLKAFNREVTFKEIDRSFFKDLSFFLLNDNAYKVRSTSANIYFSKTVEVYKEWAYQHDLPFNERLIKGIRIEKNDKKIKNALSFDHLEALKKMKFENTLNGKKREAIRDIFLFMCYTSRYYTEIINLTFEQNYVLEGPNKDRPVIRSSREKTAVFFENPLVPGYGLEIFEKYNPEKKGEFFKDIRYKTPSSSINPVLKDISKELKLNFTISIKTARDTFKTTIAGKLPSSMTAKIMGHSNLRTQDIYVARTESFYEDYSSALIGSK